MAGVGWLPRARCESGAQLIEFSLVFPLLLLVTLGIIDFGFMFQRYEVVTNAAREGARIAVLPGYAQADVRARVTQYLTAGGASGTPTVTFQLPQAVNVGGACVTLTGVTVALPHRFDVVGPLVALFGRPALTARNLTATAWMRYEGAAISC